MKSVHRSGAALMFAVAVQLVVGLEAAASHIASCDAGDELATVAHLRTDCTGYERCKTDLDEMSTWVAECAHPSESKPLLVNVGPGTFEGVFQCQSAGHVTVRGSGRETTTLENQDNAAVGTAVLAQNCEDLGFENIHLKGPRYAVIWFDGGSSSWTNVDFESGPSPFSIAWLELAGFGLCTSPERGVHYFFGSKVTARFTNGDSGQVENMGVGFAAMCSESWFFGGEITAVGESATGDNIRAAAVNVAGRGQLQAFGTLIRALSGGAQDAVFNAELPGTGLIGAMVGIDLYNGDGDGQGSFHLHGGNLVANAETTANQSSTSLYVAPGGVAHTPGSSFVTRSGPGGTATRLTRSGTGTAFAPFFWQASGDPPSSQQPAGGSPVRSADGYDMFVETDCSVEGDCESPGNHETHLMIYNETKCGAANPWFDVVTNRCRNDTGS